MKVAKSAAFLQSVVDDPRVRPWLVEDGDPEAIDIAPLMQQGIGFEFDTGGWFLHALGDGVYEAHTLFLPGSRNVLGKCLSVIEWMFCATDCTRLVTKVPADNVPADRLTRKAGFRHDYTQPGAFLRGGIRHDVLHYSLTLDDWLRTAGLPRMREQCEALDNPDKAHRAAFRWAVMNNDYSVMES